MGEWRLGKRGVRVAMGSEDLAEPTLTSTEELDDPNTVGTTTTTSVEIPVFLSTLGDAHCHALFLHSVAPSFRAVW